MFSLGVALLAAYFSAQQASAAEQSLDVSREAVNLANATAADVAKFQNRHVAVQAELDAFRSNFTDDVDRLVREINDNVSEIENLIEAGVDVSALAGTKWLKLKHSIKTVKRQAGTFISSGEISSEGFRACFEGDIYDSLPTHFASLQSVDHNPYESYGDLSASVRDFVFQIRKLSEAGRTTVMSRLFDTTLNSA
jgi:hypothetical protein